MTGIKYLVVPSSTGLSLKAYAGIIIRDAINSAASTRLNFLIFISEEIKSIKNITNDVNFKEENIHSGELIILLKKSALNNIKSPLKSSEMLKVNLS
ncbi:hypothetical protein A9Q51_001623 [Salmonella enterica subsp. enterica serovar Hadar]|nr:hypothetical protein [Salmonella enterica subsp. enterica serovar Hadar]